MGSVQQAITGSSAIASPTSYQRSFCSLSFSLSAPPLSLSLSLSLSTLSLSPLAPKTKTKEKSRNNNKNVKRFWCLKRTEKERGKQKQNKTYLRAKAVFCSVAWENGMTDKQEAHPQKQRNLSPSPKKRTTTTTQNHMGYFLWKKLI